MSSEDTWITTPFNSTSMTSVSSLSMSSVSHPSAWSSARSTSRSPRHSTIRSASTFRSMSPVSAVNNTDVQKLEAIAKKHEVINKKEWELYEEGSGDLCTIQVGGQEFKVAKNKMMAVSSVFECMFRSGMQEAQTGVLKVEDTSPASIKELIKYLHVKTLEDSNEVAFELYGLSDKYNIVDLKKRCTEILVYELNSDNILDRLTLSFMHNDVEFFVTLPPILNVSKISGSLLAGSN